MTIDIADKWALVTGASRGIGQQIALGLADHGVHLVLHSSNADNQSATKDLLKTRAVQVRSVEGLLDDPAAISAFTQEAEILSGGIDILYNNAAMMTADAEDQEFPCRKAGVEGVSGFAIGYHELRESVLGKVMVTMRNPPKNVDKLTRAMPWISLVEAGRVKLVAGPWVKVFKDELAVFPMGTHDDQIDAVSIAYEELTRPTVPLLA